MYIAYLMLALVDSLKQQGIILVWRLGARSALATSIRKRLQDQMRVFITGGCSGRGGVQWMGVTLYDILVCDII